MREKYNIRVGCDLVSLKRFKKHLSRTPGMRKRIFLPAEEKAAALENLAGIFAAKEAVVKALSFKAGRWKDIYITKDKEGRPAVHLTNSGQKIVSQDISISHDEENALAVAVFLIDGSH